jgi:hypothetical protein
MMTISAVLFACICFWYSPKQAELMRKYEHVKSGVITVNGHKRPYTERTSGCKKPTAFTDFRLVLWVADEHAAEAARRQR